MSPKPFEDLPARRNGDGAVPLRVSHPDPADLAALHDGGLEAPRTEEVLRHLEDCTECAGLLSDYGEPDVLRAEGEAELPAGGVAAARARLPVPVPGAAPAPTAPARRRVGRSGGDGNPAVRRGLRRTAWAVAAALLVAVAWTGFWGVQQQRELEALRVELQTLRPPTGVELGRELAGVRPRLNVLVVLDVPRRLRSDGADGGTPVVVRPDHDELTFVLALSGVEAGPFAVELRRPGHGTVWKGGGIRRDGGGRVSFSLPAQGFAAGRYRLRLATEDGRPLEEYPFRLQRPGEE